MTELLIGTIPSVRDNGLNSLYAVKVSSRHTLLTDGVNGLWEWNGSSDNSVIRVIDYLSTTTDNSGGAGESPTWCVTNTPAPVGHYLTWHRNRVFMADPNTSRVSYSGTRQDLWLGTDPVRPMRPWENWNVRMDMSRLNPGNGGSMVIGDPNERLSGIWGSDSGLFVFKERSIYLWTWSDSAAPHEVDRGATVIKISDGIGLVAYETIQQYGTSLIFMGQDSNSNYGVFTLIDGVLENISGDIKADLEGLCRTAYGFPMPQGVLFDGWYYLAPQVPLADQTLTPSLKFAYNLADKGWVRIGGVDVSSITVHKSTGKMVVSKTSDHRLYQYPNHGIHTDFGSTPIDWLVKSGTVNADDPMADKKWRIAWVNGDSLEGNAPSPTPVPYHVRVQYSDSFEEFEDSFSGRDTDPIILNGRSKEASITVSGSSVKGFRLRDIALGWRLRKRQNV